MERIAARAKAKKADKAEPKKEADYGEVESDALSELVDILGVKEGKADAFKSALGDLVEACVRKHAQAKPAKKPKADEADGDDE